MQAPTTKAATAEAPTTEAPTTKATAANAPSATPAERQGLRAALEHDSWVKPYFSKYRRELLSALGLGLVMYAFAALLMFTSGYLISRTAEPGMSLFFILVPVGFVQIFGIGKPILRYIERLVSHDWVFRMTSSLRLRLYTVMEKHAMHIKRDRQIGDFLGFVAEDIGHIQNLYLRCIFPTVIAWGLYVLVVVALGFFSLPFALFMLLALAVELVLLPRVSVLVNRARMERLKSTKNRLYTQLTDNVLGASDWVFAGRGEEYRSRLDQDTAAVRADEAAVNRHARTNDLVASVLFAAIAVVTLVWAGTHFGTAATGDVQGGAVDWIAAFVLGFFPLIDAFAPLPMAATQSITHTDSIWRLNDLPDPDASWTKVEDAFAKTDPFKGVADIFSDTPSATVPEEDLVAFAAHEPHPRVADMDGFDLAVEGASFAYPEANEPVLDSLSLRIPQGQKVAILGRSGSGKSTLASLLRGDLAPTAGSVRIGGIDTADIVEDIPRFVGVVAQQAYLFNRSLRENLTLGAPDATDEQVWQALEDVELADMVRALPEGLDTMVDEAGTRFSGGERHRIALARVLLSQVPVVLLDEPTVGLDPVTEQALMDTLMRVLEGKTLVMITHHLLGIESFDRVVFIEDGRLALDGSPAQLKEESERFRQLLAFDRAYADRAYADCAL